MIPITVYQFNIEIACSRHCGIRRGWFVCKFDIQAESNDSFLLGLWLTFPAGCMSGKSAPASADVPLPLPFGNSNPSRLRLHFIYVQIWLCRRSLFDEYSWKTSLVVIRRSLSLSVSKRLSTSGVLQSGESAVEPSVSDVTSDFPNMSGACHADYRCDARFCCSPCLSVCLL